MREGKTIQLQRGAAFLPSFDSSSQCFFHSLCSISLLTWLSWRTANSLLGKPRFLFLSHLCHWLKNITSQHINDKWPIKLTWFNPLWLWRWLPHRLSKSQSLSTTTVLFRTTFSRQPLTQPTSEAVHPDIFWDWLSNYMMSFKEWVSELKSDKLHVSWSLVGCNHLSMRKTSPIHSYWRVL